MVQSFLKFTHSRVTCVASSFWTGLPLSALPSVRRQKARLAVSLDEAIQQSHVALCLLQELVGPIVTELRHGMSLDHCCSEQLDFGTYLLQDSLQQAAASGCGCSLAFVH